MPRYIREQPNLNDVPAKGRIHLFREADSNGGPVALGRHLQLPAILVEAITEIGGIVEPQAESFGSARHGGITYVTHYWVTPPQLAALRRLAAWWHDHVAPYTRAVEGMQALCEEAVRSIQIGGALPVPQFLPLQAQLRMAFRYGTPGSQDVKAYPPDTQAEILRLSALPHHEREREIYPKP